MEQLIELCEPQKISELCESKEISFEGKFGDKRLAKQGFNLISAILEGCSAVLNRIAKDRAKFVGFCRFLNNDKATFTDIVSALVEFGRHNALDKHVLAIQDTTELNYSHHSGLINMKKFGPVGNDIDPGIFIHPTLLVDAQALIPLGFGYIHTFKRAYNKKNKDERKYASQPIEKKESYRWIQSAERTKKNLDSSTQITVIADREGDIYELFARIPDERTNLVVRCCRDRSLFESEVKLYDLISESEIKGCYTFTVEARKKGKDKPQRTRHDALMEVRFGKAVLKRSKKLTVASKKFVEVYWVEVKEHSSTVLPGEEPVHWRLLTTHKVTDLGMAQQIVDWYRQRWHIEQLFRILKSQGLQIEDSRLTEPGPIAKLATMSLHASLKILQLSLAKDADNNLEAKLVFSKKEIEFLWMLLKAYQGTTEKQRNPFREETLGWAAWTIARLGGWKGDSPKIKPGPITVKRGLEKFQNMAEAWNMAGL